MRSYYDWSKTRVKEEYTVNNKGERNGPYKLRDENGIIRELLALDLSDVAPVANPAYTEASCYVTTGTAQRSLAANSWQTEMQMPGALHFLDRMVYAQAYTLGFRDSFLIVALVFALALIPAWIMGRTRAT